MGEQPQPKPTSPPVNKPSDGFATYFTSSKGTRFYARDYGYEAWPIRSRSGAKRREGKQGKR